MLSFDWPVSPRLDLGIDLLVEVRSRARADPRAPERFCYVLDGPHRDAGQIHLNQSLLDRALAAAVALDNRCLKGLATQLRDFETDRTRSRLEVPLVVARPGIRPRFAALIA